MKYSVLTIMSLVIALCFTTSAGNAGSKTNKSIHKHKKATEKYSENAFCLTCNTLSPGYRGHDIIKLFNALDSFTSTTKSEYETTEQFNNRLAREQTRPILGKLTIDDIYCIMIKPEVEYDADNKLLKLVVYEEDHIFAGSHIDEDHKGIVINKTNSKAGKYRGMNAYGATTIVSSDSYAFTGIAITKDFNPYKGNECTSSRESNHIVLNLNDVVPNVARECKNNIRILIAVKLIKPYTAKSMSYSTPTINSPYANTYIRNYVYTTVKEMWIYNYKSGFVFKKIRIEEKTSDGSAIENRN
jgi:hypothetical protein